MKKNGIKNFVFSFLLSLLAVVAVNKAVFRMPEGKVANQKNIKSVAKTISLFSEKKEKLSATEENSQFAAIEQLVSQEKIVNESSLPDIDINPVANKVTKKTSPAIFYQPKEVVVAQDPNIKHKSYIDLASASEIVLEKETEIQIEAEPLISDSKIIYSDISDTLNDEKISEEENKIVYANNENKDNIKVIEDTHILAQQEESFIPITENQDALHDNIDVLTSADNSQIAMLEPNSLINSIDSFDKPEEKNIAEVNLKQEPAVTSSWTQMSDSVSEQNDSPWVVAKGNRFAKNKIAQIDALEEDEETDNSKENEEISLPESEQNLSTDIEPVVEDYTSQEQTTEKSKENLIVVHKEDPINKSQQNTSSEEITSEEIEKTFDETNVSLQILPETNKEEETQKTTSEDSILSHKPLLIPSDGNGTKLAYKMIQNLIIPLPENIATDADIVPQLSSEPNQKEAKKSKKDTKDTKELKKEEKESGLFKSISSWFSGDNNDNEKDNKKDHKKENKKKKKNGMFLFEKSNPDLEDSDNQIETPEIMPAELKLSFQPNRAEISGHTLRWIHAFADNARDNQGIYIEIRIDGTSSFALQQKRLNLLSSIFANRGVDFRKVNIIFTSREPNSFIIRNIRFNNNDEVIVNDEDQDTNYQYW